MFEKMIARMCVAAVTSGAIGTYAGYYLCSEQCKQHPQSNVKSFQDRLGQNFNGAEKLESKEIDCQNLHIAVDKSQKLINKIKDELSVPGIVVAVSKNGKNLWQEGFGYSDIENGVLCHPGTVMRIASISKSMTMAVVAKLWESGQLDLDQPIQKYIKSFPEKLFNEKKVKLTTRMLISHLSGIRHYTKKEDLDKYKDKSISCNEKLGDARYPEFYKKEKCENLTDALKIFMNDELLFEPGTSFLYTTYGWTIVSAVVEVAAKKSFPKLMTEFFNLMGLKNTYLDDNNVLISNRSRYYVKSGRTVINCPYVDNSCKWAGGGFISTVGDLIKFGNAMLYCYQQKPQDKAGYLKATTLEKMWSVVPGTKNMNWGESDGYGMGWIVVPEVEKYGGIEKQPFIVGHSGGGAGASSVLIIIPTNKSDLPSSGTVVALIANLDNVGLKRLACKIAENFKDI